MALTFRLLKAEEIEVRAAQITEKGSAWLIYKTARTDANLLDETVGPENWQNDFKCIDNKLFGVISIKCGDEWISKTDSGTEGNIEEDKSIASDAFKRAGFKWGIGRELYTAPFIWISSDVVELKERNGKYVCYEKLEVADIKYDENRHINYLKIVNKKNEVVYEFGVKKTPVKTIIESIQSQMTVENALTFYGRAIKLYPDGTPEYKEWKKAWKKKNDELTSQKTEEHLNEEKEFLDSL